MVYSGYETTFGGLFSWIFDHGFARNVMIYGADNNSLSHADNRKKKKQHLVLGEETSYDINGSFGVVENKI